MGQTLTLKNAAGADVVFEEQSQTSNSITFAYLPSSDAPMMAAHTVTLTRNPPKNMTSSAIGAQVAISVPNLDSTGAVRSTNRFSNGTVQIPVAAPKSSNDLMAAYVGSVYLDDLVVDFVRKGYLDI